MEAKEQSAMVALLPVEGQLPGVEFPHLTLVYCGEIPNLDVEILKVLSKNASAVGTLSKPVLLKTKGVEVFGDDEKVDVIRLDESHQLIAIRSLFEDYDDGEFPVYKPHVTIGEVGSSNGNMPIMLKFDRIMVGWGEKKLVFKLNS